MIYQVLLICALSTVIAGGAYYFIKIDKLYIIAGILISFLITSLLVSVSWNFIKADKLSFNEYWNGYELEAIHQIQPCHRDGACAYEYNCDPYQQIHTRTVTDSNGNVSTETYFTTEYHRCPFVTEEWLFSINTSLGKYPIARNFPENPQGWRFGVPILNNVSKGYPDFWIQAKNRIDAGKPGPVTKRMPYDNYLLASDKTILNQYNDKIQELLNQKLLPELTSNVYNFYYANKVHFVGVGLQNKDQWQTQLAYLNSGFGTELQGDVHLVIIRGEAVQPDQYIAALKAYWTNPAIFADNAISKNTVIIALGTSQDNTTVSWARAITGMPLGNEYMLHEIQNKLPTISLTPETVIGTVTSEFYRDGEKIKARSIKSDGALYTILWGINNPESKFKRISMSGNNENDNGSGFGYLANEVEPSDVQKFIITLVTLVIVITIWGVILWQTSYSKKYI